ncbi:hypothetical protein FB451DRAFT_1425030 [Mycena latifolia]|nr:hypothetical protein FB451DRAFT_1425030 [Mycena latifolia]
MPTYSKASAAVLPRPRAPSLSRSGVPILPRPRALLSYRARALLSYHAPAFLSTAPVRSYPTALRRSYPIALRRSYRIVLPLCRQRSYRALAPLPYRAPALLPSVTGCALWAPLQQRRAFRTTTAGPPAQEARPRSGVSFEHPPGGSYRARRHPASPPCLASFLCPLDRPWSTASTASWGCRCPGELLLRSAAKFSPLRMSQLVWTKTTTYASYLPFVPTFLQYMPSLFSCVGPSGPFLSPSHEPVALGASLRWAAAGLLPL